MPYVTDVVFFVLCGFILSFVSLVLGLGGGWLLTPLLHMVGLPMPVAAGTSLFSMVGSSFSAVWKHHRLKRLDLKLSCLLCTGSLVGIYLGFFILKKMPAETVSHDLRWLFILFLCMMFFCLFYQPSTNRLRHYQFFCYPLVQRILIIVISGMAGVFGGLLGVGGGVIIVPFLIYFLHMPKQTVVAANAFSIFLTSLVGTINYWHLGLIRFDYGCSLLAGSVVGGYCAAAVLTYFKDRHVNSLFKQSLILVVASLILKQLSYDDYAKILVLFTAGSLFLRMLIIIYVQRKLSSSIAPAHDSKKNKDGHKSLRI